jgi:hypothetical protein
MPLTEHHWQELLDAAMKSRDQARVREYECTRKNEDLQLDIRKLKIKIEGLEAQLARAHSDKEDTEAFNRMLQRMLKRMGSQP